MNAKEKHAVDPWEAGELGCDIAHARRAPAEVEAAVDQALAMKLVTMRLPIPMLDALKAIASFHGIGYQPMIRDLLGRFIKSEVPTILNAMQQQAEASEPEKTAPVDSFMEKHSACG